MASPEFEMPLPTLAADCSQQVSAEARLGRWSQLILFCHPHTVTKALHAATAAATEHIVFNAVAWSPTIGEDVEKAP